MPTIQSIGLSGLPLDSLLTDLRASENRVLQTIQKRQVAAETKLSAYGRLKSSISQLQKAATAVGKEDSFGAIAVKTGSDAFTATATPQAQTGKYSIEIDRLASAQSMVAEGLSDRTAAIGSGGTITFTLGNNETRTLDLTGKDTSLNGLMAAINADPDIGINATIVNDGSDKPFRLILTSRDTGTDAAIRQIDVSADNTGLQQFLSYEEGANTANFAVQAAEDAQLQVNGISISSQSNTIENVIDGLTLTLNKTTSESSSLTLSRDDSAAMGAIRGFVNAYNDLLTTVRQLTSFDTETMTASTLTGDATVRMAQTRLSSAFTGTITDSGLSLAQIGITTDPSAGGVLKIDEAKLGKALADNLDGVKSLFTGSNGASSRVSLAAETFTRTDGLLDSAADGLNRTIKEIQKQYTSAAERIDQRMETYRRQFTQLDALVSQMNSLSTYLTQQLSALDNINQSARR